MRFSMHCLDIPTISAHAITHLVSPRNSIRRLARILRACCCAIAQRQFSGEYGPFWSGKRSIECLGDGRLPISLRKFENFSQRSQTLMPRPPYKCQSACPGLVHLIHILLQVRHSALFVSPCSSLPDWQPQLFDMPRCRALVKTTFSNPHMHRQYHVVSPLLEDGALCRTVQ
jgi:hypothetical protein